jgi:hypothetical protein
MFLLSKKIFQRIFILSLVTSFIKNYFCKKLFDKYFYTREIMNEENYKSVISLPERVDEIINQVQNDSSITGALINNNKFFDDFNSLLSDLNELISAEEKTIHNFSQISLFN